MSLKALRYLLFLFRVSGGQKEEKGLLLLFMYCSLSLHVMMSKIAGVVVVERLLLPYFVHC